MQNSRGTRHLSKKHGRDVFSAGRKAHQKCKILPSKNSSTLFSGVVIVGLHSWKDES